MAIRKIVEPEDDGFRLEPWGGVSNAAIIRRDFNPVAQKGDYVALVFRVTEVQRDCDGSALYTVEQVSEDGEPTGWGSDALGLYNVVKVDAPDELLRLAVDLA